MSLDRRYVAALLISALVCGGAAPATTQPILTLTAVDQPLEMNRAAAPLSDWLKAFAEPPEKFTYTRQLRDIEEGYRLDRIIFPSPFKSPVPQNNIVPAEIYLPVTQQPGKIPAAVVLDILHGDGAIARSLAISLAGHGVAAMYFPMAYYGPRRSSSSGTLRILGDDPGRSVDALRQTVMDIRRAKVILASQPEIDPNQIGITGVSLGGIVTALAAGVDGTFNRVAPILAGGDLAGLTFKSPEARHVRAELEAKQIDQQTLETIFAPVEPLNFAARIDPAKCLMINALNDEVIPRVFTDRLAAAIGNPTVLWLPAGHYSTIFFLATVQRTAASFLLGNRVDRLLYGSFTPPPAPSR